MPDAQDVRRLTLALPQTTESTHRRRPSLRVSGRNFIAFEPDGHVMMRLDPDRIPDTIAGAAPGAISEIRRFDRPIGVRIDPAALDAGFLAALVELSWRSAAPKSLVKATFPAQEGR